MKIIPLVDLYQKFMTAAESGDVREAAQSANKLLQELDSEYRREKTIHTLTAEQCGQFHFQATRMFLLNGDFDAAYRVVVRGDSYDGVLKGPMMADLHLMGAEAAKNLSRPHEVLRLGEVAVQILNQVGDLTRAVESARVVYYMLDEMDASELAGEVVHYIENHGHMTVDGINILTGERARKADALAGSMMQLLFRVKWPLAIRLPDESSMIANLIWNLHIDRQHLFSRLNENEFELVKQVMHSPEFLRLLPHSERQNFEHAVELLETIDSRDASLLDILLKSGYSANAAGVGGLTPLHLAASQGHLPLIERLVTAGADVNAQQAQGLTALMLAADWNHLSCADYLLKHGANVHLLNFHRQTALHMVAWQGFTDMAKALVAGGCKVDQCDVYGTTALSLAAVHNQIEMAKYLVAAGADVNHVGSMGLTPIIQAAKEGHLDMVRLLLNLGADPSRKTYYRFTALQWAEVAGFHSIAELLKQSVQVAS